MRIRTISDFFPPNLKRVNQSKMCVAISGGGGRRGNKLKRLSA